MLIEFLCLSVLGITLADSLPLVRPPLESRTFQSEAIDKLIDTLAPLMANADLAALLNNCLPNTLDTTVYYHTTPNNRNETAGKLDSFVITGDIEAMWLRDSTNQVLPYIPYSPEDENLQIFLEGLIARQARSVLIDPFANAFNFNASGEGHQDDMRKPPMGPSVFEGKYEIDSLAAFLKLSYWFWRYNGDGVLHRVATPTWYQAVSSLIATVQTMQADSGQQADSPYLFGRVTSEALDTLSVQRRGPPASPKAATQFSSGGFTRSLFRPSDDAVTLPYHVPGNAMICVELTHLQELLDKLKDNNPVAKDLHLQARRTANGICGEMRELLPKSDKPEAARYLPYEVDGFGGEYFMDDANIPSLLSLPILGYLSTSSPTYQKTRETVLSARNPYFFSGTAGKGIGGPHEGVNYAWPMAIIVQAMTSQDDAEISWCLDMLVKSSAGTGLMHESFNVNDVNVYTRSWFAWANGLMGELLLQLVLTKPQLVLINDSNAITTAQAVVKVPISLQSQKETLV